MSLFHSDSRSMSFIPKYFKQIFYSFIFLCSLLFITIEFCFAQDIVDTNALNSDFYWGEGSHKSKQEAQKLALLELSQKILVTVSSHSTSITTETSNPFDSGILIEDYQRKQLFSSLVKLRDVTFYETPSQNPREIKILAYVKKEAYNEFIKQEEQLIAAKVKTLLQNDTTLSFSELVTTFYTASTHPNPIAIELDNGVHSDAKSLMINKLQAILKETTVTLSKPEYSKPSFYIKTMAYYKDKAVDFLSIRYDVGGYGKHEFVDGFTSIYWDKLPEKPIIDAVFNLEFKVNNLALEDFSEEYLRMNLPNRKIAQRIDFSNLHTHHLSIDDKSSRYFKIGIEFGPIQVKDFRWIFSDATSSVEKKLTIFKKNITYPYPFSLQINGQEKWTYAYVLLEDERIELANTNLIIKPDLIALIDKMEIIDMSLLEQEKRKQAILFGNKTSIRSTKNSWMIIVDPKSGKIKDILSFEQQNGRQSIKNGKVITEPSKVFKGLSPLYIEILEQ